MLTFINAEQFCENFTFSSSDIGDVYTWGWNESGQLGLPCRTIQERRAAEGKVMTAKDDGRSSPKV